MSAAAINRLNSPPPPPFLPRLLPFDGALSGNIWTARDYGVRDNKSDTGYIMPDRTGDIGRARLL